VGRHRQDHDQPPRGPQRLPPHDRIRDVEGVRSGPRRPDDRSRDPYRGRHSSLLLRRRPEDSRRRRLHRPQRHGPPQRARPPGPDPAAAQARDCDGGRLCDRRRPRPPRRLRPHHRRRQRAVRPDRTQGWQLRRRLRRRLARPHRRPEKSARDLVPVRAVRRQAGAGDGSCQQSGSSCIAGEGDRRLVPEDAGAQPPCAAHAQGGTQRSRRRPRGHSAARRRRDSPLLHERRGAGRARRIRAKTKTQLLEISEATVIATAPAVTPARAWWSAVRPATLAASVAPVLAGTAVAVHLGGIRPAAGLGALVVALAMQVGVNFANDYSDFVRGADTPRRVGPVRAASSGVVAPERVRWAAVVAFGVAGAVGLALSLATDWRLLVVGAACLLAGWLYTGGPRPYGYLGLGELFVFVFFGLVATCGTVYVEALRVTPLALLAGCGIGFLATAILVLNNLRDIETDAAAGKRTLATRIGRDRTLMFLVVIVIAAFTVPILMSIFGFASATVLLVLLAIPIAAMPVRTALVSRSGPSLVAALKRMAAAEIAYAMLLAVGLLA